MTKREEKCVKLLADFNKSEEALARAMRKWLRLRDSLRRAEKRLEKETAEKHSEIAGKLDARDVLAPTKPELLLPPHTPQRKKKALLGVR